MEYACVPVITAAVYWLINLIKHFEGGSEKFKKVIPILAAAIGGIIGIIAFLVEPPLIPAVSILSALIIGGASGLAATGTNQILKQMNKSDDG